jgi:uncharacterized protein YfaQ (DUF2300 family)
MSQQDLVARHPHLVPLDAQAQQNLKKTYRVDGYLIDLAMAPKRLVQRAAYWYSLWSHRRSGAWKGYLEIDLSPADDAAARAELAALDSQRLQP